MRLTLLIPELLWSEPGDTEAHAPAAASAFARLLARRPPARQPNPGWETSLLRLAGLRADSSLAVLRARGESAALIDAPPNADEARRWLCADPVHLRFHQDRLILADGHELDLEADELAGLANRLNAALAGRAEFFFRGPLRGYVRLTTPAGSAAADSQPLSRKIGCEVRPTDFGGDAALRGLANEVQMLLHADPLNVARSATGRPTLNALWLWGAGAWPGADAAPIDAIAGEHPLVGGIAAALQIPTLDADRLATERPRHALLLLDPLSTPTHYQNSLDFAAAWQALDQQHLAPTLAALRRGRLRRVDVVSPVAFGELHWQLSPLAAWLGPFGRRRWPELVSALAEAAPVDSEFNEN